MIIIIIIWEFAGTVCISCWHYMKKLLELCAQFADTCVHKFMALRAQVTGTVCTSFWHYVLKLLELCAQVAGSVCTTHWHCVLL